MVYIKVVQVLLLVVAKAFVGNLSTLSFLSGLEAAHGSAQDLHHR